MPVREFLRGGYQKIDEPTVITNRGYVMFTVWPGVRDYPRSELPPQPRPPAAPSSGKRLPHT